MILVQIVLGFISLFGLIWANQRFVNTYKVGNEFARSWAVIRSYVTEGTSPYDAEVSDKAAALLEHPLNGSELVLTQPFYSIIFIVFFISASLFVKSSKFK